MRVFGVGVLLFALLIAPAGAQQTALGFPIDRPHKAISISGFDVQKGGLTLTVARDRKGERLVGSGSAGCNSWTATIVLREDAIDVTEVSTTKKSCGAARMKTEEAFLTALKSASRWRVDGQKLILEGDSARLLLAATGQAGPATGRKAAGDASRAQARD